MTSLKFDDLDVNKAYRFLLYAYNFVGYSENASEIFVPTESNSKWIIFLFVYLFI